MTRSTAACSRNPEEEARKICRSSSLSPGTHTTHFVTGQPVSHVDKKAMEREKSELLKRAVRVSVVQKSTNLVQICTQRGRGRGWVTQRPEPSNCCPPHVPFQWNFCPDDSSMTKGAVSVKGKSMHSTSRFAKGIGEKKDIHICTTA